MYQLNLYYGVNSGADCMVEVGKHRLASCMACPITVATSFGNGFGPDDLIVALPIETFQPLPR